MRPPKTDCIFEISIKKYIKKKNKLKIDTRRYTETIPSFFPIVSRRQKDAYKSDWHNLMEHV